MFPLADCTEKTIDDYLNAAFGSGATEFGDGPSPITIIPSDRPSLPPPNPLIQYAPTLHFPWTPQTPPTPEYQGGPQDVIYST